MSDAEKRFVVDSAQVVSEIIDGEVVILHLRSGNYYSADKLGAVLWSWMAAGKTLAEMRGALASRYADRSAAEIDDALDHFVRDLQEHELISTANGDASNETPPEGEALALLEAFEPPKLNCYSDMQELLLLDPVHEVGEVGWPTPKDSEPKRH